MSDVVRWGVLGSALIARKCVVPAIVKARNGVLHGVASRTLARAEALTAAHPSAKSAKPYEGYDALINDPDVDAIYIPLPNHLHLPYAMKAFAAGKHVLCEKPLALNGDEAQEMVDAAQAAGVHLMEAFMYRFHPRSQQIRAMVQRGELGDIRLIRSAFCFNLTDETNIRMNPDMGGGALMDVGCYGVSVARWMLGEEPETVEAQAIFSEQNVDLNFIGTLKFRSGALAVVEASFQSALQQTYTIVGRDAAVELPHDAFVPWEKDAMYTVRRGDEEVGTTHTVPGADEYQLMVEAFGDGVLGAAELPFDPAESVQNMRVLDALAAAARG